MKRLWAILIFAQLALNAFGYWSPDAARYYPWAAEVTCGIPGGIQTNRFTNSLTINNLVGGFAYDTNWNASIINYQIANAPDWTTVYIPDGNYQLNGTISMSRSRVRVQCQSSNAFFRVQTTNACLVIQPPNGAYSAFGATANYPASSFYLLNATNALGSTNVTLDMTEVISGEGGNSNNWIGALLYITQNNDPGQPVINDSAFMWGLQGYVGYISNLDNAGHATIWPPLTMSLSSNLHPAFGISGLISDSGWEGGTFDYTNAVWATLTTSISMGNCARCWLKGVTTINTGSRGTSLGSSTLCEWRENSFLHPASNYFAGTSGTSGGDFSGCSGCLIENNIFCLGAGVQCNTFWSGNAWLFNYMISSSSFCLSTHQPHPQYNLIEGNMMMMYQDDGYHGSASHQTLFRNWFTCERLNTTTLISDGNNPNYDGAVKFNRWAYSNSIVGNVVGTVGSYFISHGAYFQLGPCAISWPVTYGGIVPSSWSNTLHYSYGTQSSNILTDTTNGFYYTDGSQGGISVSWVQRPAANIAATKISSISGSNATVGNSVNVTNVSQYVISPGQGNNGWGDANLFDGAVVVSTKWFANYYIWSTHRTDAGSYTDDFTGWHSTSGPFAPAISLTNWGEYSNYTGAALPSSLAYTNGNKPTWWNTNYVYPPFGGDLASPTNMLLAQAVYYGLASFGGFTNSNPTNNQSGINLIIRGIR